VRAIILCGGFGREEGGVIVSNGNVRIVNDFDMIVVVRGNYLWTYRKYHAQLELLAETLARKLSIKQIDISLKNIRFFFQNAPLTVANYELLNGHKVLYGDINLMELMPNYDSQNIPLDEGTTYFWTRGSGLLLSARYFSDNNGIVAEHNKENFVIECHKALIAMGDSILILKGKYHHSYVQRMHTIQHLDLSDISYREQIIPRYVAAIEHKVRPCFDDYYDRNLVDWWFEVQELFGKFFLFFEGQRLSKQIDNWIDYSQIMLSEKKTDWNMFFKRLIQKSLEKKDFTPFVIPQLWRMARQSERNYLLSVMPLLLFSLKKDILDVDMIKSAARLLHKENGENVHCMWNQLVNNYLELFHPGGAVAQLLRGEKRNA